MTIPQLRNHIQSTLESLGKPSLDSSPDYANAVADLKLRLCEAGLYELSLTMPVEPTKRKVSAIAQFRRVLEAIDSPAPPAEPVEGDTLNPPEIGKRLKVSADTVRGWIDSHQLKASNLATGERPRWVVKKTDLEEFLATRQPQPKPEPTARRRRIAGDEFRKYRD